MWLRFWNWGNVNHCISSRQWVTYIFFYHLLHASSSIFTPQHGSNHLCWKFTLMVSIPRHLHWILIRTISLTRDLIWNIHRYIIQHYFYQFLKSVSISLYLILKMHFIIFIPIYFSSPAETIHESVADWSNAIYGNSEICK